MRKVSVVLRVLGIKKSQKGDWLALACKLPGHFVGDDPVDAQPGQLVWTFGLDFLQTFEQGAGDIFQFVRYGQLTGYGRGQMEPQERLIEAQTTGQGYEQRAAAYPEQRQFCTFGLNRD